MVDFATLWLNHPANLKPPIIEPCLDPHGKAVFENQCSIRMSVCLVNSGISLSRAPSAGSITERSTSCAPKSRRAG